MRPELIYAKVFDKAFEAVVLLLGALSFGASAVRESVSHAHDRVTFEGRKGQHTVGAGGRGFKHVGHGADLKIFVLLLILVKIQSFFFFTYLLIQIHAFVVKTTLSKELRVSAFFYNSSSVYVSNTIGFFDCT